MARIIFKSKYYNMIAGYTVVCYTMQCCQKSNSKLRSQKWSRILSEVNEQMQTYAIISGVLYDHDEKLDNHDPHLGLVSEFRNWVWVPGSRSCHFW